jgi:hypothetical protein
VESLRARKEREEADAGDADVSSLLARRVWIAFLNIQRVYLRVETCELALDLGAK